MARAMTRTALVFDDDDAQGEHACRLLRDGSSGVADLVIQRVSADEFQRAIATLTSRRARARGLARVAANSACVFDSADYLFLDFDLLKLPRDLTGGEVAYLARCYSSCGLIVIWNQVRQRHFDLTLRDHLDSFADVNLHMRDLGNIGLWQPEFVGYRPWAWPVLPDALTRWEARVEALSAMDVDVVKVLDVLGLRDVENDLSRQTLAFVEGASGEKDPTIRQFVTDTGNGLSAKDVAADVLGVVRIAAARLARWMDVLVGAGQDVVIDAAHLVGTYPGVLEPSPTVDAANAVALRGAVTWSNQGAAELPPPDLDFWAARPGWVVRALPGGGEQGSKFNRRGQPSFDYVFCEDVSRFVPQEMARQFIADLPTPSAERFVLDPEQVAQNAENVAPLLGLPSGDAVRRAFGDLIYSPLWRWSQ
jgi:hypothetical protein